MTRNGVPRIPAKCHGACNPHRRSHGRPGFDSRARHDDTSLLSPKVKDFSANSCKLQRSNNSAARVIRNAREVLSRLEGELANSDASRASVFPARPRVSTRPTTGDGVRSPARSERSY